MAEPAEMRWAAEPLASRRKKTERKNIQNTIQRTSKRKIKMAR